MGKSKAKETVNDILKLEIHFLNKFFQKAESPFASRLCGHRFLEEAYTDG